MVAYELLHIMKIHNKKKQGVMLIKLDISKAYDKIEWPYLQVVMFVMGFSEQWVSLIMTCVTTVHYFVIVNGNPGETLTHSRSLT